MHINSADAGRRGGDRGVAVAGPSGCYLESYLQKSGRSRERERENPSASGLPVVKHLFDCFARQSMLAALCSGNVDERLLPSSSSEGPPKVVVVASSQELEFAVVANSSSPPPRWSDPVLSELEKGSQCSWSRCVEGTL